MKPTSPKAFVFVLMPFSDDFSDIYEFGIKSACQDAGAYCERVDEQIFAGNMLDRIYNQISKADLIVADMTGRNPNVFYEVGYAHALNKTVILLTKDSDDIPFDLKHYPHIVYSGKIQYLMTELKNRVRWFIENPSGNQVVTDLEIGLVINGVDIVDNPLVKARFGHMSSGSARVSSYLNILIRNNSSNMINESDFSVSFLMNVLISIPTSERSKHNDGYEVTDLHDEGIAYKMPMGNRTIFPKDWLRKKVMIEMDKRFIDSVHEDNIIRIFSSNGPRDYLFCIDAKMVER